MTSTAPSAGRGGEADAGRAGRPTVPVSTLIVNYRSYAELDRCLASLEDDIEHGHEVIVVDHASSAADLEAVSRRYPRVRFQPTPANPGFAAGVNAAARLAAGNFLLLLNPDTVVRAGALDAMRRYLEATPTVAAVGARVLDPDGSVQRSGRRFPTIATGLFGRTTLITRLWPNNPISRRDLPATAETTSPLMVDWVAGSCVMIRRDVFDRVGGMDEGFFLYWEDADLCRRLADAGWATAYLPEAVVTHLVARSSRHAAAASTRAFHRSAFRYLAKHTRGRLARLSLPGIWLLLHGRMIVKLAAGALATAPARGDAAEAEAGEGRPA